MFLVALREKITSKTIYLEPAAGKQTSAMQPEKRKNIWKNILQKVLHF